MNCIWELCKTTSSVINAISVGLRVTYIDSRTVVVFDTVIAWLHACIFLADFMVGLRKFQKISKCTPQQVIFACALLGCVLPSKLAFLRTASLIHIVGLLEISKYESARRVVTLSRRCIRLLGWTSFVLFLFVWTIVLMINVFADFGATKAWIFVKPWEDSTGFEYFDATKYFGTTGQTFLTVLQIITLDRWMMDLFRPITSVYPSLALLLLSIVFIGTFGILNVLIGLFVRECMIQAEEEKAHTRTERSKDSIFAQLKLKAAVDKLHRLDDQIKRLKSAANGITYPYPPSRCLPYPHNFSHRMNHAVSAIFLIITLPLIRVIAETIECPLYQSPRDELVTLNVEHGSTRIRVIVDTGSSESILFAPKPVQGEVTESAVEYQELSIGLVRPHSHTTERTSDRLQCSKLIPAEFQSATVKDTSLVAESGGILGLAQRALDTHAGHPHAFLFSVIAPDWLSVEISLVQPDAESRIGTLRISTNDSPLIGKRFPVNSKFYWSIDAMSVSTVNETVLTDVAVIFDTGSNAIGMSHELRDLVLKSTACGPLSIEVKADDGEIEYLNFDFSIASSTKAVCERAPITLIDSGALGDLGNRHVIVIGSRAMVGKTLGIHRNISAKPDSFSLSFN